jgi:hypothetical protein
LVGFRQRLIEEDLDRRLLEVREYSAWKYRSTSARRESPTCRHWSAQITGAHDQIKALRHAEHGKGSPYGA